MGNNISYLHTAPWPQPKLMSRGAASVAFSATLAMQCDEACSAVCETSAVALDALPRYRSLILSPRGDEGDEGGAAARSPSSYCTWRR